MRINSIRVRLPISYALIALLTTLVLGGVLLLALQRYYKTQESHYLSTNIELMVPGIAKAMQEEQEINSLQIYIQNLSYLIQVRIRLFDTAGNILADSGPQRSQQFVYTNLTPEGMSAEILHEGRVDRYLFHASVKVIDQLGDEPGENPVFLAQVPVQPALFGVEPGTQGQQRAQRSDQIITSTITGTSGENFGVLEVSEGFAFGGSIIKNVAYSWLIASFVAILIAAGSGWLVSQRFTAPLSELTKVTDRMTAGELSTRAEIKTRDEFHLLGQSFNKMAENLENIIETLRSFVADAAHELLTPVSALRLNLELAEEGSDSRQFLFEAQKQAMRIQILVDDLLDLSRIEAVSIQHTPIQLNELIRDIENVYLAVSDQKNITLTTYLPSENVIIYGDRAQLHRALENLIDNAVKFSKAGGTINLVVEETAQNIQISVKDQGIGIPEQEQPKVFQRFFRGRNTTAFAGSGLGLAIVKAIADRHEASVNLKSNQDGTTITLVFPK